MSLSIIKQIRIFSQINQNIILNKLEYYTTYLYIDLHQVIQGKYIIQKKNTIILNKGEIREKLTQPASKKRTDSQMSFSERFKAARDYVNALNNLPPTYSSSQNCLYGIHSIIPDRAFPEAIGRSLAEVERTERKLYEINRSNQQPSSAPASKWK
ncbi:hypothetical protein ABPG74_004560 [Tetrahymena malaccensis]